MSQHLISNTHSLETSKGCPKRFCFITRRYDRRLGPPFGRALAFGSAFLIALVQIWMASAQGTPRLHANAAACSAKRLRAEPT